MKIFLGGTCNNSTWRNELIPKLETMGVDYFNPVVKDWTPACQKEEIKQRKECDYCLYTITSEMTGVYSIAEAVESVFTRPYATIFCYLQEGFSSGQIKSLEQTAKLIERNGGYICNSLEEILDVLMIEDSYESMHKDRMDF
jgi:hypothetical protein